MTAYYVPTMTETYTVTFHHDYDCEAPFIEGDSLAEMPRSRDYVGWLAGIREHRRAEPRETHKAFLVNHSTHGPMSSYSLAWSWDVANAVLYLDREAYKGTPDVRELAKLVLEDYERWANGDCWGYVVTDSRGREVESLWGMVGLDHARESALADYPAATVVERY